MQGVLTQKKKKNTAQCFNKVHKKKKPLVEQEENSKIGEWP